MRIRATGCWVVAAVMTVMTLGGAGHAMAASLSHPGPIVTQDGVYDQFVESSITDTLPLYGPPAAGVGNEITFTLPGFTASASDNASDLTAGAMEFILDADPGLFIKTVSLFESGTFNIVGDGSVSASGALTVRYLDESTQQLVTLVDPIHRLINPLGVPGGTFPAVNVPWGDWLGVALIDLDALGIQTRHVIVTMDNNLIASAELGGAARISKDTLTVNATYIPEPGSMALIAVGLGMIVPRRRREAGTR